MAQLFGNNPDGANHQARAVLAFLSNQEGVQHSWNSETKRYDAEPTVARWHNCREQGYVISLKSPDYRKQLNIAFYEHRIADDLCALMFETDNLINPPTIHDVPDSAWGEDGQPTMSMSYGHVREMADWIADELGEYWEHRAYPRPSQRSDDVVSMLVRSQRAALANKVEADAREVARIASASSGVSDFLTPDAETDE